MDDQTRFCPRCGLGVPPGQECDCYQMQPYRCIECGDVITEAEHRRYGMCSWCAFSNDPEVEYGSGEERDDAEEW